MANPESDGHRIGMALVLGAMGVIGAAIAGSLTDWFGLTNHRTVEVRVVAFNVTSHQNGLPGVASVQVANEGNAIAENCFATWYPGIHYAATGTDAITTSQSFSLTGGQTLTLSLQSSTPYPFTGFTRTSVSVHCSNGDAPSVSQQILVGLVP